MHPNDLISSRGLLAIVTAAEKHLENYFTAVFCDPGLKMGSGFRHFCDYHMLSGTPLSDVQEWKFLLQYFRLSIALYIRNVLVYNLLVRYSEPDMRKPVAKRV